ncbi:hypothetical protein HY469_05240 [Candidatus Roizmanbacteria bacterium]|nr:hypothetical protein [Candidatus Roizmanbacteria bacterium]
MLPREITLSLWSELISELDPNIVPLVSALNNRGFRTYSSCEGHIGKPRTRPEPWVAFHEGEIDQEQFDELEQLLTLWNQHHHQQFWGITLHSERISDRESEVIYILEPDMVNYDRTPDMLEELQNQAKNLAYFLSSE